MNEIKRSISPAVISIMVLCTTFVFAQDWPQWQGVNRDGKSVETGLLKTWSEGEPELVWRTGNLGDGFGGVSVVGDRLYVMGGLRRTNAIMALDTEDGEILWSTEFGVAGVIGNERSGNTFPGPRCTPTVDGGMLYGVDHLGEFICVTAADGRIQWSRNFVDDFGGTTPMWGSGQTVTFPWGDIPAFDKVVGQIYAVELTVSDPSGNTSTGTTTYEVVPEPATMALLAAGGLTTLMHRRRKWPRNT